MILELLKEHHESVMDDCEAHVNVNANDYGAE